MPVRALPAMGIAADARRRRARLSHLVFPIRPDALHARHPERLPGRSPQCRRPDQESTHRPVGGRQGLALLRPERLRERLLSRHPLGPSSHHGARSPAGAPRWSSSPSWRCAAPTSSRWGRRCASTTRTSTGRICPAVSCTTFRCSKAPSSPASPSTSCSSPRSCSGWRSSASTGGTVGRRRWAGLAVAVGRRDGGAGPPPPRAALHGGRGRHPRPSSRPRPIDSVPANSVAVVYPLTSPFDANATLWQASAGMRFQMPSVYALVPAPAPAQSQWGTPTLTEQHARRDRRLHQAAGGAVPAPSLASAMAFVGHADVHHRPRAQSGLRPPLRLVGARPTPVRSQGVYVWYDLRRALRTP